MMAMYHACHSTIAGGQGALSINLTHLPYPGLVLDQPSKLLELFEVIKTESYKQHTEAMKRAAK
jgi:hypothetical protein